MYLEACAVHGYMSRILLARWRGSLAPSLGGAVPAAAAPRHRHHSPHNEPRVRWEGWVVRVGSVPRCGGENPAVSQAVYMDTCERQTPHEVSQ